MHLLWPCSVNDKPTNDNDDGHCDDNDNGNDSGSGSESDGEDHNDNVAFVAFEAATMTTSLWQLSSRTTNV